MTRLSGLEVTRAVAAHYGLHASDLIGACRERRVARPRQVAMYAMRRLCPHLSSPAIGSILGGRDHTTVLYGVRNIEHLIKVNPDVHDHVVAALSAMSAAGPAQEFSA